MLNSGKRKRNEVEQSHHLYYHPTTNFPRPANRHHFATPSNLPHPNVGQRSQAQQILNTTAATIRPFSFMDLLMGEDSKIEQMLELDTILRESVGERQEKSLNSPGVHKDADLGGGDSDRDRRDLGCGGWLSWSEGEPGCVDLEDAESHISGGYVDETSRKPSDCAMGSVCKVCERRLATVMMLPCRHQSVCMWCNNVISACPVCRKAKRNSVQVIQWYFPTATSPGKGFHRS